MEKALSLSRAPALMEFASTRYPLARSPFRGASHLVTDMKLPNQQHAVIKAGKVSDYLLSTTHPAGRHKARFFARFGFSRAAPEVLIQALTAHAESNEVSAIARTKFGSRYAIDGALNSPDGRNPRLRVIWFVESGGNIPNFVTAYPLPEPKT